LLLLHKNEYGKLVLHSQSRKEPNYYCGAGAASSDGAGSDTGVYDLKIF
jgi:hypothetical protein